MAVDEKSSNSDISQETIKGFVHLMGAVAQKQQQIAPIQQKAAGIQGEGNVLQGKRDEQQAKTRAYSLLFNQPMNATITYVADVLSSPTSPDDLKLAALELASFLAKNGAPAEVLACLEKKVEAIARNSSESEKILEKATFILVSRFKRNIAEKELNGTAGAVSCNAKEQEAKSDESNPQLNKPSIVHHQSHPKNQNNPQAKFTPTSSNPIVRPSSKATKTFTHFCPAAATTSSFIPFSPENTQPQSSLHHPQGLFSSSLAPPLPQPLCCQPHSSDSLAKACQNGTGSNAPTVAPKKCVSPDASPTFAPFPPQEYSMPALRTSNETKDKSVFPVLPGSKVGHVPFCGVPVVPSSGYSSSFSNSRSPLPNESTFAVKPFFPVYSPAPAPTEMLPKPVEKKVNAAKADQHTSKASHFAEVDELLSNLKRKQHQHTPSADNAPKQTFVFSKAPSDVKKKAEEKIEAKPSSANPLLKIPGNALIASGEGDMAMQMLGACLLDYQQVGLDRFYALKLGIETNRRCELCGMSVSPGRANEHIQLHSDADDFDEPRIRCPVCSRNVPKAEYKKHSAFHHPTVRVVVQ
ncbi:uncharacterized protein MONOS_224 [Monocercomonoides exilis]|uniref:uncharacterized protein n=1 Tax=Monocercomonoides exilis TaxID=2049356 RepID=UPI00355ABCA7|nr:hypothetical protein MONOS_224 [Monocercomonoides exilis]|eukprot:MONOS_224.1-p1 / transcript=MONOS_224.1 / gene=MONOS_224 / organism=Monocercomonoides_exilis_PA203 / gene_product=unspecified product / transcript_product=unspecified product / location=Mono_scaffold00004:18504-20305(-) / protein_length=580 / sequence_SO=supercontig / SO=protein_coding / is_pseudo=false